MSVQKGIGLVVGLSAATSGLQCCTTAPWASRAVSAEEGFIIYYIWLNSSGVVAESGNGGPATGGRHVE